jgi:MFS family permease
MFDALRHRNFRLFYAGQFVSLIGTWMQSTAQSWLVYRLTKDPLMLGVVALVSQLPVFALGFHAGYLVDRSDHLRLVKRTQFFAMVQAVLMAALCWTGQVRVWHVVALALMLGVVNAFDMPARQVLIGELVPEKDRHNAIALNSTIVNGSRIVGPALAGLAIAWIGEPGCFLLNALSFIAVLASLALMRGVRQPPARTRDEGMWREVGEGLSYAFDREPIRLLLLVLCVYSLVALPIYVLLPVFAEGVLHAGAKGFGWLSSSAGVGATFGALRLARRRFAHGLGGVIAEALVVFSAALLALGFSRNLWLSCALMWVVGWSAIQTLTAANTALQELSDDQHRGRVMGLYAMSFVGLSPIGSFLIGGIAARLGVSWTVVLEGILVAGAAALYGRRLAAALPDA